MESENLNYKQKKFAENLKTVQILEAFQKLGSSQREDYVFGCFAKDVAIRACFEGMKVKRGYEDMMLLIRTFEDKLSNARVDSESLLLMCNSQDESDFVILEPLLPFERSRLEHGNRFIEELIKSLIRPQYQFSIVMAVDVDHAKLWLVSEDFVAGPLKLGKISEDTFIEKNLFQKTQSLYPGFSVQGLKSIVLGFHESCHWIISKLQEVCEVKSNPILDIEEDTFERLVMDFSDVFSKTNIARECNVLKMYFNEVDRQDGNTTRGRRSTGHAINNKLTRSLLVTENASFTVFVVQDGNKDKIILRDEGEEIGPEYHGQQVREKMPFMVWLRKNHTKVKGEITLISPHTEHGKRLEGECQGIGAILDTRRDLPSDED